MPNFIECPRCETTGAKSWGRNMCTRCNALRIAAANKRLREHGARPAKSSADVNAMKGFNPISQHYLSIKL